MRLDEVGEGSNVFIDANVFIYHFTGASEECSRFLSRRERAELVGITSVNVILEVLHRLMMIEAVRKNLVKPPNIVKKLNRRPELIKTLSEYFLNTKKILDMGIHIKPITFEMILKSQFARGLYGLMVNDSLILAAMQDIGLTYLATHDAVFTYIHGLQVCSPRDVKLS